MLLKEQLEKIALGDEDAFRSLVLSFSNRVCHYALSLTDNKEDAEEIVSDVFLKVWQLRQALPPSGQFAYYLYKAVKNTSLNYVHKRKNIQQHLDAFRLCGAHAQLPNTPMNILISTENIRKIEQAINSLPQRCRQIFIMIKKEGMTYQQVAALLDISPATVNAQMTIAIKKMWQLLSVGHEQFL